MKKDVFDVEEKYKEAKRNIKCEKDSDLEMKKSLSKYKELNCPNGTNLTDWLEWNVEEQMKEMKTRLNNGEHINQIFDDFRDRTKNKFYY